MLSHCGPQPFIVRNNTNTVKSGTSWKPVPQVFVSLVLYCWLPNFWCHDRVCRPIMTFAPKKEFIIKLKGINNYITKGLHAVSLLHELNAFSPAWIVIPEPVVMALYQQAMYYMYPTENTWVKDEFIVGIQLGLLHIPACIWGENHKLCGQG